MSRWKTLAAALFITHASMAQNQGCIAAEITEAYRSGYARIRTGYSFTPGWSAEVRSSFHIFRTEGVADKRRSAFELSFRHWQKECYNGSHISLGITTGFRDKTDMTLGIGYCLPVWRGIGIDIGYGIRVLETIRLKSPGAEELTIEICYIF